MAGRQSGIPNMAQFRRQMATAGQDIDKLVGTVTRKIGLDVLNRVVTASPVDTGAFRGAWQADINQVSTSTGSPDKGGGQTVADGAATIQSAPDYCAVNISNALPYSQKLAAGSSKMAPSGWIENAVDAASRFGR